MASPLLSDDARDRIVKDYVAGVPIKTIAARYGVCESYPTQLARRRGVARRNKKRASDERA